MSMQTPDNLRPGPFGASRGRPRPICAGRAPCTAIERTHAPAAFSRRRTRPVLRTRKLPVPERSHQASLVLAAAGSTLLHAAQRLHSPAAPSRNRLPARLPRAGCPQLPSPAASGTGPGAATGGKTSNRNGFNRGKRLEFSPATAQTVPAAVQFGFLITQPPGRAIGWIATPGQQRRPTQALTRQQPPGSAGTAIRTQRP